MNKPFSILSVFFSLLVLISCSGTERPSENLREGVIVVANKSGDDVYFIDRRDGALLKALPAGPEPHEVEVSDDGRIAVVCNYGGREVAGHTLSVFDIEAGELIRTIDLGEHTRPHGMQWISGTTRMLVTTEGSQSLLEIDVSRGEVIKAMYTGEPVSHMVAATPEFTLAFVPSIRTGNVVVFDLETGNLIETIYSGEGAEGIAMHPAGLEVWVTNRAENTLTVIDTQGLKVVDRIPCADFPIRAKFTPDGRYLLVSNARSGDIGVFETASREQVARIKLTPPAPEAEMESRYFAEFEETSVPIGLVVPDNRWAYVANTRADVVSIIDLESMEITGHLPAGREPDGIHHSPLCPAQ